MQCFAPPCRRVNCSSHRAIHQLLACLGNGQQSCVQILSVLAGWQGVRFNHQNTVRMNVPGKTSCQWFFDVYPHHVDCGSWMINAASCVSPRGVRPGFAVLCGVSCVQTNQGIRCRLRSIFLPASSVKRLAQGKELEEPEAEVEESDEAEQAEAEDAEEAEDARRD